MCTGLPGGKKSFIWSTERILWKSIWKMSTDAASAASSDAASKVEISVELPKLRRVRGGHEAYSTKTVTQTTAFLNTSHLNDSLKLRQNKKVLEEKPEKVSDLDEQMLGLLDDEDTIAAEINELGEFRESV